LESDRIASIILHPLFFMSSTHPDTNDSSRPSIVPALIPPAITVIAVLGMLGVARIYDSLPLQAPGCSLRMTTGIPCLACGGTRSMMALAHGDFQEALSFNPLIFLGVISAALWLAITLIRLKYFPDSFDRPRRMPVWAIVMGIVTLFAANWIYLLLYLPE
jgi:hypothetical protein